MTSTKFLSYFQRELHYLRQGGAVFAAKHPKIARRLDWTKGDSKDPHVERLIESFAYLSAQLHQNLDDRFPQIAAGLLQVLYPHLINPLPSVTIAQFEVDPLKAKMTTGYPVARHTPLFAYAEEGLTCRFRTTSDVTLWPIVLEKTEYVEAENYTFPTTYFGALSNGVIPELASGQKKPWYIKFTLRGENVANLEMNELTFHLAGTRTQAAKLYQALFASPEAPLFYSVDGKNLLPLPPKSLEPKGFSKEEQILPSSPHSHPSYQLLQEYFHFPEKYFFFTLKHLIPACRQVQNDVLEIFIPLADHSLVAKQPISPQNFLLGCTPIVNLFHKITDPLRLTHKTVEYRLSPDNRLERTHEIFSIQSLHSVSDDGSLDTYAPYYSFEHNREGKVFWTSRRESAEKRHIPGTDVYLSFVDKKFDPLKPPSETIYADVLCTNRFLAEQIPAGAPLGLEGVLPVTKIICLDKPVSPAYSPADGETLWKLVSQLAIHHVGYTDAKVSLQVLKETLHLYAGLSNSHNQGVIDTVTDLSTESSVRRLKQRGNDQVWMGFVRGVAVNLTLNEDNDPSGMGFVLASVIRHFLSMNVDINSFIQMNLFSKQRKGAWVSWLPLSGQHHLL